MNALRMPALCQSCGERGSLGLNERKPSWCKCTGKGRKGRKGGAGGGGPYVAPTGFIACFTYFSKEEGAFREQCRLAGNAEREARDGLSARFVRSGAGYRELPRSSPRRRALETAYRAALRELERLQALCPHPSRSLFNRVFCDVCYAHVECDVAHYQHLAHEVGRRAARRLAV